MNEQAGALDSSTKYRLTVLGAGFIGRNFIRLALARGYVVRVLDRHTCPVEFNMRVEWFQGDVGSEADVRNVLRGGGTVLHFVSSTVPGDDVDESQELQNNVSQTIQLLKMCVEEMVDRIVFTSSSSVYGLQETFPIAELAPTDPISSHGIHKLTIEKYLHLYHYRYGLDCKIARLSNPYGPGQSINGRQGFVAIAIGCMLRGDPIPVRGDGSAVRDFMYVGDVVEALLALAKSPSNDMLFNVGSGIGYTLNDVVIRLRKLAALPVMTVSTEGRYVDIPKSVLEVTRINEILGKSSRINIDDGLASTLAYHGVQLSDYGRSVCNNQRNS